MYKYVGECKCTSESECECEWVRVAFEYAAAHVEIDLGYVGVKKLKVCLFERGTQVVPASRTGVVSASDVPQAIICDRRKKN